MMYDHNMSIFSTPLLIKNTLICTNSYLHDLQSFDCVIAKFHIIGTSNTTSDCMISKFLSIVNFQENTFNDI